MALTPTAAFAQQASFASIPPPVADSLRFGAPLPAFEAKDTNGRTWRLEDLRGKFTLIYLWNTFEARAVDARGPWVREIAALPDLPEIQRFHSKVKGSANVQVLAFCSDYDYTHASEYMRSVKFDFPVIADWALIRKLFPAIGLAGRYAVVNPEGRLSEPFRSWSLGRVLFELENAAARN